MLKIRKAQVEDSRTVYEIRNDEEVIRFFFDSGKVSFQDHDNWFRSSLQNNNRYIYIVTFESETVGVVRFDLSPDSSAEVSIFIARKHWGKGFGKESLLAAEAEFLKEVPACKKLRAKVFTENASSLKLFEKCQYEARIIEFEKEVSK